jgi:hypothetical protein
MLTTKFCVDVAAQLAGALLVAVTTYVTVAGVVPEVMVCAGMFPVPVAVLPEAVPVVTLDVQENVLAGVALKVTAVVGVPEHLV